MRAKLHMCPNCSSELCQPIDWAERAPRYWVLLRCPECGHERSGTYSKATVSAFDTELDRGTKLLLRTWYRMGEANMAAGAMVLHAALACDGLLPEDFH